MIGVYRQSGTSGGGGGVSDAVIDERRQLHCPRRDLTGAPALWWRNDGRSNNLNSSKIRAFKRKSGMNHLVHFKKAHGLSFLNIGDKNIRTLSVSSVL